MKLVRSILVGLLAASAVACGGVAPTAQAPTGNEVGTTTITSALTHGDEASEEATPRVGKAQRSKRTTEDLLEPKHVSREGKKTLGFGTK